MDFVSPPGLLIFTVPEKVDETLTDVLIPAGISITLFVKLMELFAALDNEALTGVEVINAIKTNASITKLEVMILHEKRFDIFTLSIAKLLSKL
jgi:hypothetical protein